tara:strand:+ start:188 stop:1099 length:912 start_codon:yes stop_codon:yes gene_type:complete
MSKIDKYIGNQYGTPVKTDDTVSIDIPCVKSQRDLNQAKVNTYIHRNKGVNWNIFIPLVVARFPDGGLWLIDGQHRRRIIQLMLPDVTQLPAMIVDCTPEQAALWFDELNGGSSSARSSNDEFWSKICRGDQFANIMFDTLRKTNFNVGKANKQAHTRDLPYAGFSKALAGGEQVFLRSCEIVDEVYPKDKSVALVLEALSQIFRIKDPKYQQMADPNTALGRKFVKYLIDVRNVGGNCSNLARSCKRYHNAGPTSLATAYGICKAFFGAIRSNGHSAPKLEIIQEKWQSYQNADTHSLMGFN